MNQESFSLKPLENREIIRPLRRSSRRPLRRRLEEEVYLSMRESSTWRSFSPIYILGACLLPPNRRGNFFNKWISRSSGPCLSRQHYQKRQLQMLRRILPSKTRWIYSTRSAWSHTSMLRFLMLNSASILRLSKRIGKVQRHWLNVLITLLPHWIGSRKKPPFIRPVDIFSRSQIMGARMLPNPLA